MICIKNPLDWIIDHSKYLWLHFTPPLVVHASLDFVQGWSHKHHPEVGTRATKVPACTRDGILFLSESKWLAQNMNCKLQGRYQMKWMYKNRTCIWTSVYLFVVVVVNVKFYVHTYVYMHKYIVLLVRWHVQSKHFPITVENSYVSQPFILQLFPENYIPACGT